MAFPAPYDGGRAGAWLKDEATVLRLSLLLLLAAGVLAYANAFGGVFLYDDLASIVRKPAIRSFPECVRGSSRPLVHLSFWLNYAFDGYRTAGYHLVNLAIHIANGWLLLGIVRRTAAAREPPAPAHTGAALTAALLWLVHPLQTQSVTYIVQRSESLTGLFYLLTLYCFVRATGRARAGGWAWCTLGACWLGMLTKPVFVSAPLALLLYDRAFRTRSLRSALRARPVLYAGLAAAWAVPLWQTFGITESSLSAGFGARIISPQGYLATQPGVILHYLRLAFYPHPLCLNYAWAEPAGAAQVLVPAACVLALLGLSVVAYLRRPRIGYAAVWFWVTLAPSSSIVPLADYAAEHRMYLPLAGLLALLPAAAAALWSAAGRPGLSVAARVAVTLGVAGTACSLGYATRVRNRDYRSAERMWRSVVACRPDSHGARINLCGELIRAGRHGEAERHARYVVRRLSRFAQMSRAVAAAGERGARGFEFGKALSYYVKAHTALGIVRTARGAFDEAERHLLEAVRLLPRFTDAHWNLVLLEKARGRPREALARLDTVLELEPNHPYANASKGMIEFHRGKRLEAAASFRRALIGDPRQDDVAYELAWLLAAAPEEDLRDGAGALSLARRLARSGGRGPAQLDLLAAALAAAGDFDAAVRTARSALALARAGGGSGDPELATEIERRLAAYRRGLIPPRTR